MTLRGSPRLVRRVIEDIQDIFYVYKNKLTGKAVGQLQVMPREVKVFEMTFPATAKGQIKKDVEEIIAKHNKKLGGVAVHWGPWKKDKFKNGYEMI